MNPLLLAELLKAVGTIGIPLIVKLSDDLGAGRTATTVTAADLLELHRLSTQRSADLYARAGLTPPPAA